MITGKNPGLTKIGVAIAVVAFVVEVALIWYAFHSATANISGAAYYIALSLAWGATLLATFLFILSFFGIGLLIGLLLAIADYIGSFFGVSISGWLARLIGEVVLTVKILTRVDSESVDFKLKEATWENPAAGPVPGNKMTLRAVLQGLVVPEAGGSLDDAAHSHLQGSGVNLPASMAVRIDYTILYKRGHGCAGGHCPWWEDTDPDSGSSTSGPTTIYLDVLPKTIGELWAWNALQNHDPDGDGLTTPAEIAQGTSPTSADTDQDGLDDGVEVRLAREGWGANPLRADNDGLTDREERLLGTLPNNSNTDGDGLSDGRERAGYMMNFYGRYPDAWAFPDPLKADADRDGLIDGQEFALKTNPNAGAVDLNAWTYSTNQFVKPDADVSITVVGINFTGRTNIQPHIQVRLPPTIPDPTMRIEGQVRADG